MDLLKNYYWAFEIAITLVVLFIIYFIAKYIISFIQKKIFKTKKEKRSNSFLRPIKWILFIIFITFSTDVIVEAFDAEYIKKNVSTARNIILVILTTWLVFKFNKELNHYFVAKIKNKVIDYDRTSIDFIFRILSLIIAFIAFLIILNFLGADIMPLIAFGGVGAAVVGFAGKDMFSNFFGALMLHITRPFSKGDVIDIPEKSIYGVVEDIGWYMTLIIDLETCPHYIPNSIFSSLYIKNISRRTNRRIDEKISVRYKDFESLSTIIDQIEAYLKNHISIENTRPIQVYFTTYNAYSLDISIKAYTKTKAYEEFMSVKQEVLLYIKKIIENINADIPFPTTTVEISK